MGGKGDGNVFFDARQRAQPSVVKGGADQHHIHAHLLVPRVNVEHEGKRSQEGQDPQGLQEAWCRQRGGKGESTGGGQVG